MSISQEMKKKKKSTGKKKNRKFNVVHIKYSKPDMMIKIHKMCPKQMNIPMIFRHLDVS